MFYMQLQWRKNLRDMQECTGSPVWGLIILVLLIILNGIFYGFAAAIRNISENDVSKKAAEGNKKAGMLLDLIERPQHYLNLMPLIMSITGILIGLWLIPFVEKILNSYLNHWLGTVLIVSIIVLLLWAFGILTFRRIGTYNAETFAYRYIKVIHAFTTVLAPVTAFVSWVARAASIPFGIEMEREDVEVTEEEIISIVGEAHEQGVIEENEAEMIQNVIEFNEKTASEIMTHRKNVVAFSNDSLLNEVINVMLEEGNSRYPVLGEDMDDIVGMITYKDVMKFKTQNTWAKFKPLSELPGLIREAVFVPETRGIGDLFHTMQVKKVHMVLVVDEYGQTSGIVSMEDILEEIVGEIQDEYDDDEVTIRKQLDNSVIINGLALIHDVEETLGIEFGEIKYETLNGYLTSRLGHIPTEKDLEKEIVAYGYRFKILSLGNKTIGKVRAEKINEKGTEGEKRCQDIQNLRT